MKRVFSILVLLIGFIVTSCVNDPKRQDNVRVITVDITKQSDISEFVSSFDGYVCLETNEDCLVDEIRKLKMVGDTIYIADDTKITMFSRRDGSYLGKIHKQGRGPGEYITLTNFDVFDSKLYVLSSIDEEIIEYSSCGDVLRTIDTKEGFRDLLVMNENNIWLYSSDSNDLMYNFILINSDSNVKAKYDSFSENQSFILSDDVFVNQCSDTLYTAKYFDNTVYVLHSDGYYPKYRFNMNLKYLISQEELSSTRIKVLYDTYKYKETLCQVMHIDRKENTLFAEILCFLDGLALKTCFVKTDMVTGKSHVYIRGCEVDERFPLFDLSNVIGYDGKVLISYLTAFSAKKYGKKYKIGNLADISEYDNPVIVFHTLNY